jgi:hypothetical protein
MKHEVVYKLKESPDYTMAKMVKVARWIDSICPGRYTPRRVAALARTLVAGSAWTPEYHYLRGDFLSEDGPCTFEVKEELDEEDIRERDYAKEWTKVNAMLEAGANGVAVEAIAYCKWIKLHPGYAAPFAG